MTFFGPKRNGALSLRCPHLQSEDNGREKRNRLPRNTEYRFYCEFQSHEPEFDYLKSLEIEEKINRIRWRHGRAGPLFLVSTNDKTIKLWKIYEKKVRMVSSRNVEVRATRSPHGQGY